MNQLLHAPEGQELVQQQQRRDVQVRIVGRRLPGFGVAREKELDQEPHKGTEPLQVVRRDGDIERHRLAAETAQIEVRPRRGPVDERGSPIA
jgi:hypothetical protein